MLTLNSVCTLSYYDVRKLRLPVVRCSNCCFQISLSSLPSESSTSYSGLFQPLLALAMQSCYTTQYPVLCITGIRWLRYKVSERWKGWTAREDKLQNNKLASKEFPNSIILILEFLQKESLLRISRDGCHHTFIVSFLLFYSPFRYTKQVF